MQLADIYFLLCAINSIWTFVLFVLQTNRKEASHYTMDSTPREPFKIKKKKIGTEINNGRRSWFMSKTITDLYLCVIKQHNYRYL